LDAQIMVVSVKAIMISGRTLGQGAACEAKMSPDYFREASSCSLSQADLRGLGISPGENLEVTSEHGSVILAPQEDQGLDPGIIFIPMGPWANCLVGPDTSGCGTPQYKGVHVEVKVTTFPVLAIRELFGRFGRTRT